jgi:hypothetical protein
MQLDYNGLFELNVIQTSSFESKCTCSLIKKDWLVKLDHLKVHELNDSHYWMPLNIVDNN